MPAPDIVEGRDAVDPDSQGGSGRGEPFRPIADARVVAAMRLAEARLDMPPTTAALAAAVGLSQFHFLRLFQARTGETVSDYIRRVRLDAAALHLRGSREPIVSIALSVGYGSQAAFTRAFTGRFGRSPANYRRGEGGGAGRAGCPEAADPATLRGITVRRVPAVACIGRRYLGSPHASPEQWRDFRDGLPPHLGAGRLLSIVHDDPRITPPDQIRVDHGLVHAAQPDELRDLAARGLQSFETGAGLYAVIPDAGASPYALLDGWLAQQGRYRPRGGTGFLAFHAGDGFVREVHVPIRTAASDAA